MSEPTRTYRHGDLVVEWHDKLCIHCKNCLVGLPEVFKLERKPWVDLSKASPEEVRDQVEQCPSGALRLADPSK